MLKPFLKQAALFFIVLALLFGLAVPVKPALAVDNRLKIVVNDNGDEPDAGTTTNICETENGNGVCTLRAAIMAATRQSIDGTLITFNIQRADGVGPTVIDINSALPALQVENTTIQGPNLHDGSDIALDGGKSSPAGATRTYEGVEIKANLCAIKNLTISDFGGYGIVAGLTSGPIISGIVITSNKIGNLTPFSIIAQPNSGGIKLVNVGSSFIGGSILAERNIISGNTGYGVHVEGGGTNNIKGNLIGVRIVSDTTQALANSTGIYIKDSSSNTIGGDTAGERNIISGNGSFGINIEGNDNYITGNYIGTDVTGTSAIPNGANGVRLGNLDIVYSGNQIGGLSAGEGNLISGNGDAGIAAYNSGSITIRGNTIGLNAARTAALPNRFGIALTNSSNNYIGGTLSSASNVISGNTRQGIFVGGTDTDNTSIWGNYIGVNSTGVSFPNGLDGIMVQYARNTIIGGSELGARNIIANNGDPNNSETLRRDNGIELEFAYAKIEENSIYGNADLGIDVLTKESQRGVTPNDVSEADNVQNFPGITGVSFPNAGKVVLQGQMTTYASEHLNLYFYGNAACDSSGYGEGQVYLGYVPKIADTSGRVSFLVEFTLPEPFVNFSATAWGPTYGNSEFSPCRSAGIFPPLILDVYLPLIMK